MKWFVSLLVLIFALHSNAEPQPFDFEDEKGINHILVILDAPLEFISGKGDGVSGFISYDPTRPQDVTGSIHLTVDSIELNNSPMTKNMYGKKWLNAKEHPEISFVFFKYSISNPFFFCSLTRFCIILSSAVFLANLKLPSCL